MKLFKAIIDYIEKHKSFVKKLILFVVITVIASIFKNDSVVAWFNTIFSSDLAGELVSTTTSALSITCLVD